MKKSLPLFFLAVIGTASAQDSTYNKLSAGVRFGLNNPVNPMAGSYDSPTAGFFHTEIGVRYMFNPKFGLRVSGAYDHFKNKSGYTDFKTNYMRVSLEGVVNAGNVLHFHSWTKRFGLLVHTGIGYSSMIGDTSSLGYDQMIHGMLGITPQVKLNDRFTLSLDATAIAHIYQSRTYDFSTAYSKRGVDGFLVNLSVGIQYNFGKNKTHADWVVPVDLSGKLIEIERNLAKAEDEQKDEDSDGVPNYLDQEPGTAAGAEVNTKGITQIPVPKDSDSDGVTDDQDDCPFAKGPAVSNGCPDTDADGIADKVDDCPLIAGIDGNHGCPEVKQSTLNVLAAASKGTNFVKGKEAIVALSRPFLDRVADELRANPQFKLVIGVHTDAAGEDLVNLALTQKRADEIKHYLISRGIENGRLIALGFGETQPVAGNDTPEGSAANRRVELKIKF